MKKLAAREKTNRRLYLEVISLVATSCGAAQAQTNQVVPAKNAGSSTNITELGNITVTADLDRAREQIAPDLGAVAYTIGQYQIETTSQGDNSSFQQLALRAPGIVQDEFGEARPPAKIHENPLCLFNR